MEIGIYEKLITTSVRQKLDAIDKVKYEILQGKRLDAEEAAYYISLHLLSVIKKALGLISVKKDIQVGKQIEISNNLLKFLSEQIEEFSFEEDIIDLEGRILEGVFNKLNNKHRDLQLHLSEIMPASRLSQSELFTGGNVGLSLESELRKEIRSSNRIDLLVSFIKWPAIRILLDDFKEFIEQGGQLRVITTTYVGATDAKAIQELSALPNTEIKICYNIRNERLHAKAYLFYRNTGYHTAYIGSSNFSRSALTTGLEWNIKVTTQEVPHILDKFSKTFQSYWNNPEFELYEKTQYHKLDQALRQSQFTRRDDEDIVNFFDLKPYHFQKEILEKLRVERNIHKSFRNLIVAATGTGKTMIAAFDFKQFYQENPFCTFLFIAHRIEIVKQARRTFRNVLKNQNFGELMGDGYQPSQKNVLFTTIQTLNNLQLGNEFTPAYFDYIIFDEVHHAQAQSYQKIITYFNPKILLGLTATPERMDGQSILDDFNYRFAAEIRLPDALNQKLLCPFQYFGISDSIDYRNVQWRNGKYNIEELTNIYTANDVRVGDIIHNLKRFTKNIQNVSCLGFCVSQQHAKFMAEKFRRAGLNSQFLISENSHQRSEILTLFKKKEINYLFVVDIFNEGVDIPQIDTVLFLRPTESLTIFLQQLGRGLRLDESKEMLTVIDFVGQARDEYDFENKFRALIGKTNSSVLKEVEKDFPNLPLGCSIVLEKQAKEYILENIRKATQIDKRGLIKRIQSFAGITERPLTIKNFLEIYNLKFHDIYKNNTFSDLKAAAFNQKVNRSNEERYKSMFTRKWIVTESCAYFQFVLNLINNQFDLNCLNANEETRLYALMLYYDFYQAPNQGGNLEEAILEIGKNENYVEEMKEILEYKIDQINFEEFPYTHPRFIFPLRIHARYTRDQIFAAMGLSTFEIQSSVIEGVASNKETNVDALFVNLQKTEEDFSPTTMYDDYAINETLFHWQSQNRTSPDSLTGQSYIQQEANGKEILLFIREAPKTYYKCTQGYVFIGSARYVSHEGSKPMSVKWELKSPIPDYLWKESAKMAG